MKGCPVSYIKIFSPPPGRAPEEVKKELVGLVISLPERSESDLTVKVFSGEPYGEDGYQVKTNEVMPLLFRKSRRAAIWYLANAQLKRWMMIPKEVCELLQ